MLSDQNTRGWFTSARLCLEKPRLISEACPPRKPRTRAAEKLGVESVVRDSDRLTGFDFCTPKTPDLTGKFVVTHLLQIWPT